MGLRRHAYTSAGKSHSFLIEMRTSSLRIKRPVFNLFNKDVIAIASVPGIHMDCISEDEITRQGFYYG